MSHDADFQMALMLQQQFEVEFNLDNPPTNLSYQKKTSTKELNKSKSLIDPSWELVDPTPNIFILFVQFNEKMFWNKLLSVTVAWSKRMTTCAGICSYQGRGGMCKITLSEPLLKLRPRKDLIETLLHEMIHAFLFVTHNNKDRDGHGPEFHKHMYRINNDCGTNITVYHDFHDEVKLYKQHWWRCDGACVKRPPFFGMVRRAMNRAPGPNDRWFGAHQQTCGGKFIKVKEPEKNTKSKSNASKKLNSTSDIRKFIPTSSQNSTQGNSKPVQGKSFNPGSNMGMKNRNGTVLLNPKTYIEKENIPSMKTDTLSKTSIPSSGNIVGFKDLTNGSNQKQNVTAFTGSGYTLTANVQRAQTSDYSRVRAHWVNTFSKSENSADLKRKSSEIIISPSKKSKVDSPADSMCPNCNKLIPQSELNSHLDECLSLDVTIQSEFSNELNDSHNLVECPVCNSLVEAENINSHLDNCMKDNTDENLSVENEMSGIKSDKAILRSDNLKRCEMCDTFVECDNFDEHAYKCLNKYYDEIDEKYDLKKEEPITESVLCLVCNKNILKSNLNNHLEDCMVSVFDNDEDIDSDNGEMRSNNEEKEEPVDVTISKCYNCPICMKGIEEEKMNCHIDECLNFAASNENLFED